MNYENKTNDYVCIKRIASVTFTIFKSELNYSIFVDSYQNWKEKLFLNWIGGEERKKKKKSILLKKILKANLKKQKHI